MGTAPRGSAAWARLGEARVQAHWAAQVVASAGETLAPHAPDTSHTALVWDAERRALIGRPLAAADGCRMGLRLGDLALFVLDARGGEAGELALAGRTLAQALRWAQESTMPARAFTRPPYELPLHPLACAAAFQGGHGEALEELARRFDEADRALRDLDGAAPGAGEVLCWPHHFDLALSFELERDAVGAARTVGVGFSPGDEFFAQPYWYVNHGPETARTPDALPPLAAGAWFTGGWTGAVLRADALDAAGDPEARRRLLGVFLQAAVRASAELAREAPLA